MEPGRGGTPGPFCEQDATSWGALLKQSPQLWEAHFFPSAEYKAHILCPVKRERGNHSHWHVRPSLALARAQPRGEANSKHLVASSGLPDGLGEGWATEEKTHSNKPRQFGRTLLRHRTSYRRWRCHRKWAWGSDSLVLADPVLRKPLLETPGHTFRIGPPGSKQARLEV